MTSHEHVHPPKQFPLTQPFSPFLNWPNFLPAQTYTRKGGGYNPNSVSWSFSHHRPRIFFFRRTRPWADRALLASLLASFKAFTSSRSCELLGYKHPPPKVFFFDFYPELLTEVTEVLICQAISPNIVVSFCPLQV